VTRREKKGGKDFFAGEKRFSLRTKGGKKRYCPSSQKGGRASLLVLGGTGDVANKGEGERRRGRRKCPEKKEKPSIWGGGGFGGGGGGGGGGESRW